MNKCFIQTQKTNVETQPHPSLELSLLRGFTLKRGYMHHKEFRKPLLSTFYEEVRGPALRKLTYFLCGSATHPVTRLAVEHRKPECPHVYNAFGSFCRHPVTSYLCPVPRTQKPDMTTSPITFPVTAESSHSTCCPNTSCEEHSQ